MGLWEVNTNETEGRQQKEKEESGEKGKQEGEGVNLSP